MDGEDESSHFLKLLSDGSNNVLGTHYLLQNQEDGFTSESIFTELTSDWPSEGLPIFLSGTLLREENEENDDESNNVQSVESEAVAAEDSVNTVTIISNLPQDNNGLFLSNDVVVQLQTEEEESQNNNIVTHIINGNAYSVKTINTTLPEPPKTPESEVIQLLNINGTITTINKNVLACSDNIDYSKYYSNVQAVKCKFCTFLSEKDDEMKTHLKATHVQEIQNERTITDANLVGTKVTSVLNTNNEKKYILFLCSECGNGYSKKEDLKQHMIMQHNLVYVSGPSEVVDDKKNKQSERTKIQNLLKKQEKEMKKFPCTVNGCTLRFATQEVRIKHENCHFNQQKKQFQCPECKEKFSLWRVCSSHLWKSHKIDLGLVTCPMCSKFKANSLVRVLSHMAIHNEEKPFICASCGKDFKTLKQMRYHEITHKAPDEVPNWLSAKQCQICDRYFANSKSLQIHIKFVHEKFKQFICNICGHQTARKAMLQLHQRQHTGVKPHHCQYCDYKTGDHNCLRRHTMRHFGVTKYSCQYCEFKSIQTSAYKAHMKKSHPGKEGWFSCQTCTYTSVNRESYMSHIKCHEIEKKRKAASDQNGTSSNENASSDSKSNGNENKDRESTAPDDDEIQNFLNTDLSEDAVDTGGITIPAEFDL